MSALDGWKIRPLALRRRQARRPGCICARFGGRDAGATASTTTVATTTRPSRIEPDLDHSNPDTVPVSPCVHSVSLSQQVGPSLTASPSLPLCVLTRASKTLLLRPPRGRGHGLLGPWVPLLQEVRRLRPPSGEAVLHSNHRVGKLQPLESRRDACEPYRIKCHVTRRDGRRGAGAQRGRTAEKNSRESLCRTPAAAVACDLRRLLSCHVIPARVAAHGTGNSRAYAARRGRGFGEGQESSV